MSNSRERFLSVQHSSSLHATSGAKAAVQRLPRRSVVPSSQLLDAGRRDGNPFRAPQQLLSSAPPNGNTHSEGGGRTQRNINFDRLEEQEAIQQEAEEAEMETGEVGAVPTTEQTSSSSGSGDIARLLDDGLDDVMAALPLDVDNQPAKRRRADDEPSTSDDVQETVHEFASYDSYSTADLLTLQQWSELAARHSFDTVEIIKHMRRQHRTASQQTYEHNTPTTWSYR